MEENGKNMYVFITVYIHIKLNVCVCVYVHVHAYSVVSNSFTTPWTVARQAPLSMEFSRQEYWSGLPLPSPGNLPNLGIKPVPLASPGLQADSLLLSHQGSPIQLYFHFF